MTTKIYPNGIGGTLGDQLDTCRPLWSSGSVWYVSSLTGTDGASPAGQNREKPLATLAQAQTNAADGDFVVFLQGHTQTLGAGLIISKRLTLMGEGFVGGKPGASFLINNASQTMFDITAPNVELRNIYFPPCVQSNTGVKVDFDGGANGRVIGCYFEAGANDKSAQLEIDPGADGLQISGCTFISVAPTVTAQPAAAIQSTGAINDLEIADTVISSGTSGWSNYWAIDLAIGTALRTKISNLSLLLGSDVRMGANATGRVNVQLATGGSRIDWT
jgi:hypothetical protein